MHEPAGHQYPGVHSPSHVAAVRTVAASPYAPALHCAVHVEMVRPVVAPYLPHAHNPLHAGVVCATLLPKYPALHCPVQDTSERPIVAPYVPAGQAFCVGTHEPAGHQ